MGFEGFEPFCKYSFWPHLKINFVVKMGNICGFYHILDVFSGWNKDNDMIPSKFCHASSATSLENQQTVVLLKKWLPKTQKIAQEG